MFKTAEKLFLAGLGALAMTTERVEKKINDLVEKGQMGKEEARNFLQELVSRGEEEKTNFLETIRRELIRLKDDLGLVTREEIEEIKGRIARLEELLQNK